MPVLRLTTIGRRSGRPRSVILTSPLRDGDATVVVASKGGADHHPAWYLNLRANPEIVVETRDQGSQTRWARVATADERARLWPLVTERFSDYGSYQDRTDREIPLVLLEPLTRTPVTRLSPIMPRAERPAMSSYGVPSDPDGVLPWEWAEERLLSNRNYWVVTVDTAARPHAMPVWGLWDSATASFWFSCAPDSLKARNLATNPHVVVATADTVEVVSLEGIATLTTGDRDVAEAYAAKYEPDDDKQAELADFVLSHELYQVVASKALGVIERADEFAERATRWVW